MVTGQRFVALTGTNPVVRSDVFVFYDRESSKFGVLHQTPAFDQGEQPRLKDDATGVPLHRVSDVFMGKRAPEFQNDPDKTVPSNQCFSIVSKERSMHLIAPSEPIRAVWLAGVKQIFALQKEAAAAKKAQQAQAAAAAAAQAAPTTPAASTTAPTASTPVAGASAGAVAGRECRRGAALGQERPVREPPRGGPWILVGDHS